LNWLTRTPKRGKGKKKECSWRLRRCRFLEKKKKKKKKTIQNTVSDPSTQRKEKKKRERGPRSASL